MTSSTSAPSPADEDHRLIKGLVVCTLLLDVLERDILYTGYADAEDA
ncbi:hypothetical protein Q0F98_03090 [Paenibacillus amylolyticus]|nr:hypothetical protein Q0F98_03090 [Paenibacillus amylolyticus]